MHPQLHSVLRALEAQDPSEVAAIAERFRSAYYASRVWEDTTWFGHHVLKSPLDLWLYQELLWMHRPDVLIETGTWEGGSAQFFATVFDALGHGEVWSIDVAPRATPEHQRVHYIRADSTKVDLRDELVGKRVAVSLDSDHAATHVAAELEAMAALVTPGQFLVVEDTYPCDALVPVIEQFVAEHAEFGPHPNAKKYMASYHAGGWLLRSGEDDGRP